MECPSCRSKINLKDEDAIGNCLYCEFYFYFQHSLRIACSAVRKIDVYEKFYFKNVHQRIYGPFIEEYHDSLDPEEGALLLIEDLVGQLRAVIQDYPKEDLLMLALALRELATWKILVEPENTWASVQVRNVAHVFSNLITSLEEDTFSEKAILYDTDFISAFVLTEEIDKLVSNVLNTRLFKWTPSFSEMIKTRIENQYLEWFHGYFEVLEFQKPEEIIFHNERILRFLERRQLQTEKVKKSVGNELEKLFGFSFQDLHDFRESVISIAEESEQVFEIMPLNERVSMKVVFVFRNQLKNILIQETVESILNYLTYKPSFIKGNKLEKLSDPYLDYKFIFEYEDMIAFGVLDSGNSITMFKNITSSDHFIQDIFGETATGVFKKAQENISYLIGLKIAEHFMEKEGFFVPTQQKGVPLVNFKTLKGNAVKRRINSRENMDLGDIDAVFVDNKQKKVILLEIKYYKPAVKNIDMLKKDGKIFEDIPKILKRATWFKENIDDVIKAWNLEEASYTVETYLVTGRPNYYGKSLEEKNLEIKYFTFDKIMRL